MIRQSESTVSHALSNRANLWDKFIKTIEEEYIFLLRILLRRCATIVLRSSMQSGCGVCFVTDFEYAGRIGKLIRIEMKS